MAETAAPLRPLPSVADLSEAQLSGTACVWGGGSLAGSVSLVDLGTQPHPDGYSYWFPRACVGCHFREVAS